MTAPVLVIRSALAGVEWPAMVRPDDATSLALQFQLERSQWLAAETLRDLQSRQLYALLRHADETVPHYRWHWHGAYQPEAPAVEALGRLPVLRTPDLRESFDALRSASPPAAHGRVYESRGPGPGGTRILKTELVELWWRALTLRDHLWHQRDFSGKLAAIREGVARGEAAGWGPATETIADIGRSATLPMETDLATRLEWLVAQQPDCLLTHPAVAAELAAHCMARGVNLPRLREVRTIGELPTAEMRELCRRAWGASVTDMYSRDEAGYIALQCPRSDRYHVQSESVLVEVLDDRDQPCAPGAAGRVVVTTLQNFAMPLVRYDTGDYAEVGVPCDCGRGLPLIRRLPARV